MREALAAAKQDLSSRDDRRSDAPRNGKRAKAKSTKGWLGFLGSKRRPTVAVLLAFVAVAAIGVPLNALYLQDGRHPAPMFQAGLPIAAAMAPPQQRPAVAHEAKAPPAKADITKAEVAKAAIARSIEKARNPIKKLLVGGAAKKGDAAGKNVVKNVVLSQRSLAKPGYGLRPGGANSKAIEKLARAPGLPAKAETALKLPPKLAAKPGVAKQ